MAFTVKIRAKLVVTVCVLSALLVVCPDVRAAKPPSVKLALSFKPSRKNVEYETPGAEEFSKCRVKVERSGKQSGWVVFGPAGQVLRRFIDTNADNVVDQWKYYNHGLEVYRDIDTNANNKIDQFRWLNTGGTRWGIDADEDGQIDSWKTLSAEEATAEAVRAMAASDTAALKRLLVTGADLKTLGLNAELSGKLLEAVADPEKKLRDALKRSKILTSRTRWVRFDSSRPGTIPADDGKATTDLRVYQNVMAIVETAGQSGLVYVGEMILVGDVWKLTQIPQPMEGSAVQVTTGGILMQPTLASATAAAGTDPAGIVSPTTRKLLDELQKLDRNSPMATTNAAELARYNTRRAGLLERLAADAVNEKERIQWMRQLIEGLAAAIQTGGYSDGLKKLQSIEKAIRAKSPKSELLAYVIYRRLVARYNIDLQTADNRKRQDVQKWWLAQLEQFAADYPTAEDTPEAILQLAIAYEFSGKIKDARKRYETLVRDHAKSNAGLRAAGAIHRLGLKGKQLDLAGAGLSGGTVDVADHRGKVVLVLFWSTWCKPCTEDLPQIRELYRKHHAAGFEIIGVNLDTARDPIGPFMKQHEVTWPQIYEPGGLESKPARSFGIISLPTMFLLDRTGKVLHRSASVEDLKSLLPDLLGEDRKSK